MGGPGIPTHRQIAATAFEVLGKPPKITFVPDWIRKAVMKGARSLTRPQTHGPIEFMMTGMAMDMVAPRYGSRALRQYFIESRERSA